MNFIKRTNYFHSFSFILNKLISKNFSFSNSNHGQLHRPKITWVTINVPKIFNILQIIWHSILSYVLSRAWITQPRGIHSESHLIFTLGYKLSVLVSRLELTPNLRYSKEREEKYGVGMILGSSNMAIFDGCKWNKNWGWGQRPLSKLLKQICHSIKM